MDIENIPKEKTDIRHFMAIDRTILSNERTYLAYVRTSLSIVVVGLSFLHFTQNIALEVAGALAIPIGFFTFIFGTYKYVKRREIIRKERELLFPEIK